MDRFIVAMTALCMTTSAIGSGFQLWEQDNASIGNVHAGYAALAQDATIAFNNPAGITRIKHQQMVIGSAAVITDIKFKGLVEVNTLAGGAPQFTEAKAGATHFIPDFNYVIPLNEVLGFGFSVNVPFGVELNYGKDSVLRYTAYKTSVHVLNFMPSLAWQVTPAFSVGAGMDAQKMRAEFNEVGRVGDDSDTDSITKASDTAFGFTLGSLYQFSPNTRMGLSYHSRVHHHLAGSSRFEGPISEIFGAPIVSDNAKTKITLPAYTAFSLYHRFHPKWALMGSAIYTQWDSIKKIKLKNLAGLKNADASSSIMVILPQHFKNTWSVSTGADYYFSDQITLRAGVGWDQSPSRKAYRTIALPDNNRYAIALGLHYQAIPSIGFDLGWTHLFVKRAGIHHMVEQAGDQMVTTNGHVRASADIVGGQVVWNMI